MAEDKKEQSQDSPDTKEALAFLTTTYKIGRFIKAKWGYIAFIFSVLSSLAIGGYVNYTKMIRIEAQFPYLQDSLRKAYEKLSEVEHKRARQIENLDKLRQIDSAYFDNYIDVIYDYKYPKGKWAN